MPTNRKVHGILVKGQLFSLIRFYFRTQVLWKDLFLVLEKFLLDLERLIGERTVHGARHLLQTEEIHILTNPKGIRFLAIIGGGRQSSQIYHLYPHINYCHCKHFQVNVLGAERILKGQNNSTCKHILALRLACFFERIKKDCENFEYISKLKYEILPTNDDLNLKLLQGFKPADAKYISHQISIMQDSQEGEYEYVCVLDNIKSFTTSIDAVNIGNYAFIRINENGFRCTVEQNKCFQANLFIPRLCFTEYHLDREQCEFTICIKTLYECLSIYLGTECSLKMHYSESGGTLRLLLVPHNEINAITECLIKTIANDDFDENSQSTNKVYGNIMEFALMENENDTINTIHICGPELANIFNGFDKSADQLEIFLSPSKPYFQITALGVQQAKSQVEIANVSDILMLFDCKIETRALYKSSFIKLFHKALIESSKVVLKMTSHGLLEMHCIVLKEEVDNMETYIQFYVTAMIDNYT